MGCVVEYSRHWAFFIGVVMVTGPRGWEGCVGGGGRSGKGTRRVPSVYGVSVRGSSGRGKGRARGGRGEGGAVRSPPVSILYRKREGKVSE